MPLEMLSLFKMLVIGHKFLCQTIVLCSEQWNVEISAHKQSVLPHRKVIELIIMMVYYV